MIVVCNENKVAYKVEGQDAPGSPNGMRTDMHTYIECRGRTGLYNLRKTFDTSVVIEVGLSKES